MIDKTKFVKVWKSEGKTFGIIKLPAKISKNNVREHLDIEYIKIYLAPNIKQHGLQQFPVANGNGEIFIGSRRCKALEINGKKEVQVEIRDIPDIEQQMGSLFENDEREDITADEEGKAFLDMCRTLGISQRELARKLKKPESSVRRPISIYKKIKPLLRQTDAIPYEKGYKSPKTVTYGKATLLLGDWIPRADRKKLIDQIENEGMTRKQLERFLLKNRKAMFLMNHGLEELDEFKDKHPKKAKEGKEFIEKSLKPLLFTKDLDPEKIDWYIREIIGYSTLMEEKLYPLDKFDSFKEADKYAKICSGRCLGKEVFWKLNLDTIREKMALKKVEKMVKEEKKVKSESKQTEIEGEFLVSKDKDSLIRWNALDSNAVEIQRCNSASSLRGVFKRKMPLKKPEIASVEGRKLELYIIKVKELDTKRIFQKDFRFHN